MKEKQKNKSIPTEEAVQQPSSPIANHQSPITEFGGRNGPEPTRYGDYEVKGKCVDF